MIYVTHDQIEAMTLADKIVVLDKRRIAQVGTPLDLYNQPANKFVAGFIGSPGMNFIGVTAAGASQGRARVELPGGGRAEIPVGAATIPAGALELGARPEHLKFVALDDPAATLKGDVAIVEHLGNSTIFYVDTPAGQLIVEGDGASMMKSGELVGLALDAERAHLFGAGGAAL